MNNFLLSRIYKDHAGATDNNIGEDLIAKAGSLQTFLRQGLKLDEAQLLAVTGTIQSLKKRLNKEAASLELNCVERERLIRKVNHLESLRQQLLAAFLSKQSAYQSLEAVEENLGNRSDDKQK